MLFSVDPDRHNGTCILSAQPANAKELLLFEPRFNLYARRNDCTTATGMGMGTTPLGSPSTTTNVWTAPGQGTTSNDFITAGPQSTASTPFSGSTTNQNTGGEGGSPSGSGSSTPWESTSGPSTIKPENSGYGVNPTSDTYPSDRPNSNFGSERPTYRPPNDPSSSGYERPTAPSGYDRPSGYETGGTASSGFSSSGRPNVGYGTGYSYGHADANKERERAPYHPNAVTGQHFDYNSGFPYDSKPSYYPTSYPTSGFHPAIQSSPTAGYGGSGTSAGGPYYPSPTSGPNYPIIYHDKNSTLASGTGSGSSGTGTGGGSLSGGYNLQQNDQIEENRGK